MKELSFRAKNTADAERHLIACNALVEVLLRDPRVEERYQGWLRGSELADLVARWNSTNDDVGRQEIAHEVTVISAATGSLMLSHVLPAFVSRELRLPYPWLAVQLGAVFMTRFSASFGTAMQLNALLSRPPDSRSGRRAKGGGESIRRNVEWFYRVHVKEPRDSIYSLAKAYKKQHGRETDPKSVVQNGIKRAKELLDLAEYVFLPEGSQSRT